MKSISQHLAPVLLLALIVLTHAASSLSAQKLRDGKRSILHERDAEVSSGLPPPLSLNTTDTLCQVLPLPTIASTISDECGSLVGHFVSTQNGSDEEMSAIEAMCTAECAGKLIQFFSDECQSSVVAGSLIGLCTYSSGERCYYAMQHYNWTALEANCLLSSSGVAECSEKCAEIVLSAVETVECCTNYDHQLAQWTTACGLSMPEQCPDPFKDGDDKKEDEEDEKTEYGGKNETGIDSPALSDGSVTIGSFSSAALMTFSILCFMFLFSFC